MKNATQLDRIETMLKAVLASNNHIHWIGSYAHGRTSSGDPYVVLFPASDKLEHKVCRVYESQFKRLPNFVDTAVPASVKPSKDTPKKDQGIACRNFQVVTSSGKDTQMGAEKRFFDVIAISSRVPQQPSPAEQADSFFRVGDKVEVKGRTRAETGIVTGLDKDGKVAVRISGKITRWPPERVTAVALA